MKSSRLKRSTTPPYKSPNTNNNAAKKQNTPSSTNYSKKKGVSPSPNQGKQRSGTSKEPIKKPQLNPAHMKGSGSLAKVENKKSSKQAPNLSNKNIDNKQIT